MNVQKSFIFILFIYFLCPEELNSRALIGFEQLVLAISSD
jgi:hypothetical protein